jgi:F-type H+-transporting ATPase subunit epsilon
MKKSLLLQLVTPVQIIYQQEVERVTLDTLEGEITVLPHHEPLVAVVVPGEARIVEASDKRSKEKVLAVSEGVVEVRDNRARILVEAAERIEELDRSQIIKAKAAAEEMIESAKKEGTDEKTVSLLRSSLQREMAKLRIYDRHRGRRSL